MNSSDNKKSVTVYYDGECPFCRWEVDMLQQRQPGDVVQAVDISAADFQRPDGVDATQDLMDQLHVRNADGRLITGMPAVRSLYRASGWGRVAEVTDIPVLSQCFDLAYVVFARWRVPLGRGVNRISGWKRT